MQAIATLQASILSIIVTFVGFVVRLDLHHPFRIEPEHITVIDYIFQVAKRGCTALFRFFAAVIAALGTYDTFYFSQGSPDTFRDSEPPWAPTGLADRLAAEELRQLPSRNYFSGLC
jgi:hypothetical protein